MPDAQLPRTDLHVHAESAPHLDRVLAAREGRAPYDWIALRAELRELPPGMPRLEQMNGTLDAERLDELDQLPDLFIARVEDTIEQAASAGAVLVEVRFGAGTVLRPGFDLMALFREAEQRVQSRYPGVRAEPLISGLWPTRPNAREVIEACVAARDEGLAGVDFLPDPYEEDVGWTEAYRAAERLAGVGLGITAHAGEFAPVHLTGALGLPGLSRIGHGIHAAGSPSMLAEIAERGITLECCITSNVVYGAVDSLEQHPLRQIVDAGVQVTISTDNPVRLATTIDAEYAAAASLGFDEDGLRSFTRSGIEASFTSDERKAELLATL